MALSAFHLATFLTRRYQEGANARLKGEPRDPNQSSKWLAGWDEGDELLTRIARRTAMERTAVGHLKDADFGKPGQFERNGSNVVAFVVTFAAVFVVAFPVGVISQNLLSLLMPDLIWSFRWSDWPIEAAEGTILGPAIGLWQAGIAAYPEGNAAGNKLWWQ
ncbi:hypothetical protein [Burkholderia gladioli]|uniref:hypothetical protein n=1 Tax=Burkholderia gladioli TaxID=28095 RepID=UPI00163EE46F|nr:hypothetical protein [Burkholderia gladioli]